MPNYFNPDALTDAQRSNWDAAMREYPRVLERNLEHKLSAMTVEDRASYSTELGASTLDELRNKLRQFGRLASNPPGHPKSALFARLLEGKAPLQFPPPTSFSYPWYSVMEEEGPHRVEVGGAITFGSLDRSRVSHQHRLTLNQCVWTVRSLNEPGQRLLELAADLKKRARRENPQDEYSVIYDWTTDFLDRVKAVYSEKPEFTVQFANWPRFRLHVCPSLKDQDCHSAYRKYVMETTGRGISALKRTGSVFDLDALRINQKVGKVLNKGRHPKVKREEARAALAQSGFHSGGQGLLSLLAPPSDEKRFLEEVATFEADPDQSDWVQVSMDMWYIEKHEPEVRI